MSVEASSSWRTLLTREYAMSLALVSLSVWLHAADSMLVATMVPAIVGDIGGVHLISWTVSLYEIGSIVSGVAGALLTVRHGLHVPMTLFALCFAIGCAISALAPSMWILLVGRLFQGIGGGGLVALSFIAVGMLFPRALLPRALASISLIWGASAFLGPLIGGLFVEYATWRYGFWLFCAGAMLLGCWIMIGFRGIDRGAETPNPEGLSRFPVVRLMVLCLGVLLIAFAGVRIDMVLTPLLIVAGISCMVWFVRRDSSRTENRFLPRQPVGFSNPVGAGLTMILAFTMATIAISVYGPLILIGLHGTSALVAGYVVASVSVGWTIAAVSVSGADESQDRKLIGVGMLLLSISICGFLYSIVTGPLWLIALFAVVEGAGFGMAWTFILRRVTALSTAQEQERVAGAIPPMQRLGYALGAACIGVVANAAGLVDGATPEILARAGIWVFAAGLPLSAVGLYAAWVFLRSP